MRKDLISPNVAALLGAALPWLVVPTISLIMGSPPSAVVALFFLTLVIFFAIKFSLLASIANAISGFLVFTLFFSDSHGSVQMQEEEGFFTAAFFLLTAFYVGHLASRHNKYLNEIRLRERLSTIEIQLLDQLIQALDQEQVFKALASVIAVFSLESQLIRLREPADVAQHLPEYAGYFNLKKIKPDALITMSAQQEVNNIYLLHDNHELLGLLKIPPAALTSITKDTFRLLIHQANIALERSRLLTDLAQEKIAKENELLRSALLSSISHDFRTPLTTMIGATSTVLEMGPQLAPTQIQELLGTVVSEAERLNRYTQNLLDMTRLGFGQLRLERHWISLEELINSLSKRVKPLLQTIKLDIQIEDDLPLLNIHAALVEQALFNVVDNAIKFSPSNSSIVLRCHKVADKIQILIADQGPGIPVSERSRVFERFYTADRGDRRRSGSGLGLTICCGMINAHGGHVSIHSNDDFGEQLPPLLPDTGCCVNIELPISKTTEPL